MKEEFPNRNFVFGIYFLLAKTLNLFSVEHKIQDQMNQEMLHMLWSEFIPEASLKHICKNEFFFYLNGKNVLHPKTSESFGNSMKKVLKIINL